MLKNAHLRRQDIGFGPQRTGSTPRLKSNVLPCNWTFLNINLADENNWRMFCEKADYERGVSET